MTERIARRKRRYSFTPDEDDRLRELVSKYGTEDWSRIASKMRKRETRQCRERWINYLAPNVVRTAWTPEEDTLLAQKVSEIGRKWQRVAQFFAGRTDINVKNRWNHLRKHNLLGPLAPPFESKFDPFGQFFDSLWQDCPDRVDPDNFGF
jgi:hypothetical protein